MNIKDKMAVIVCLLIMALALIGVSIIDAEQGINQNTSDCGGKIVTIYHTNYCQER